MWKRTLLFSGLVALCACKPEISYLATGDYLLSSVPFEEEDELIIELEDLEMALDADQETITLSMGDELVERTLTLLPEDEWPEGCPGQFGWTAMQTASIDGGAIELGSLTIDQAMISAQCAGGIEKLVIYPEGINSSQGGACGEGPCLAFEER